MNAALLDPPPLAAPGSVARPLRGRVRRLALAYIFAIFPLTPAFVGFAALRPPGVSLVGVPLAAAVLAGAVIAAGVLAWPARARPTASARAMLAAMRPPLFGFLGAQTLSALCGIDPGTSLLVVAALAIAAIVHLAILRDGASARLRRLLLASFLVSATLASAVGFLAWATQRPASLMRVVNGRAVGTFVVPGEFAGYLVLAIAVAAGVAASRRGAARAWAWATLLFAIPALAATYSRAGWYGCSIAMAAIVVAERPKRWVVALTLAALAIEAPLLLGVSDHHNPSEEFARLPIWTAALRAAALYPLTGTGPGAFRHLFAELKPPADLPFAFHPHSAVLGTLTESGVLGAVTALALAWRFGRSFARRLSAAHPARRPVAVAIAAGLCGTAVQASVDEIQVLVLGCWMPFMALALAEAGSEEPS